MKSNLKNWELLKMLEEASAGGMTLSAPHVWKAYYGTFCKHLAKLTDSPCTPGLMRELSHLRVELASYAELLKHIACGECATTYCNKALHLVDCELHILELRIEHPAFSGLPEVAPVSPLYLDKDYCATDLVELITPLYELGFLTTASGSPAKLKTIVRAFETTFNVRMPNYDVLRHAAINRKLRLTPLLDRMREVMLRLSQE